MIGWIKVHRSVLEKGWSNRPDFVALWIHLLLQATHEKREVFWNGNTIILLPGQFISGRLKMAAITGIQESKLERILKCFESEQQIEQRKTSTSRLISICNWNIYQEGEQPFEQRMNNERTTNEQRVNTKQEYKELKNDKNVRSLFKPPTEIEIENYILENQVHVEFDKIKNLVAGFFDHYQSNGWLVGKAKAKMRDWQAAVRNWIRMDEKFQKEKNGSNTTGKKERVGRMEKKDLERFLDPDRPIIDFKIGRSGC